MVRGKSQQAATRLTGKPLQIMNIFFVPSQHMKHAEIEYFTRLWHRRIGKPPFRAYSQVLTNVYITHTEPQPQNSTRQYLARKRQLVLRMGVKQCWELKRIALKSSVKCWRRKPLWPFYYFIVSHLKKEETGYSSKGQGHFEEKRECCVWE